MKRVLSRDIIFVVVVLVVVVEALIRLTLELGSIRFFLKLSFMGVCILQLLSFLFMN
jgi:hypothetical protein